MTFPYMTSIAITLICISAVAHALWNLVGKRRNATLTFYLIANLAIGVLLIPVLIIHWRVLGLLPVGVWILVAVTGLFQGLYFTGLSGAYQRGDISLAYPLLRSLPVIFVALANFALGRGEQITLLGLAGFLLVAAGCLMIPLPSFRGFSLRHYLTLVCLFALVAALGTTGYSLVDDQALRLLRGLPQLDLNRIEQTLLYMSLQTWSTTPFLMAGIALSRAERQRIKPELQKGWIPAALTGLVIAAAYGLVLAAMGFVANVSYVVAFRQLSIPLGAILGLTVEKEPRHLPKIFGIIVAFTGLILVALG
jgi:drug/metabolite transporter (DMT)-like permease